MREVRLIAISDDGTRLILSGDDDEKLALQIDESLHAAIRGDRARLGQLEIQLENQLRPKDIQARIRAGESVEAVAAVAGMPLEKVRRFAGPVLAEREHIAGRARQATIRRVNGDGPPRMLDDAASSAAAAAGVDPDTIEWDAWRREDGRWQVQCSWRAPEVDDITSALFSFDPSGRSVLADDDAARSVAGDVRAQPEPAQDVTGDDPDEDDPAPETAPVRLSVVPAAPDYYPVADDDLQATLPQGVVGLDQADSIPATAPTSVDERRARRTARARPDRRRVGEQTAWPAADPSTTTASASPAANGETQVASNDQSGSDEPATDRLHLSDIASRIEDGDEPEAAKKPAKPARSGSRSRRPSVPTWDEIMFGRRKPSD